MDALDVPVYSSNTRKQTLLSIGLAFGLFATSIPRLRDLTDKNKRKGQKKIQIHFMLFLSVYGM